MLISVITTRAKDILQDTTSIRWPEEELFRWISDAQREVVLYRPEAYVSNTSVQLTAQSSKQNVPTEAVRLLDVVRNMGSDGTTAGRAIRLVSREIMDAQNPNWHVSTPNAVIQHFIFDARDPKTFYVYPRPNAAVYVEAILSMVPPDITSNSQSLVVPDIFANPILDYTLFRAYTKDSEYAGNAQRAMAHYQSFANAMGIKGNVDTQFGPTANSPLNPNSPN